MKVSQETHTSFWGSYQWPHPQYNRFQLCAGLEKTADETDYMTAAFSNLSEVTELGLSLDSGLGWLAGPDVSDRARIFNEKAKVFGPRHTLPDAAARARVETWRALSNEANVPFVKHIVFRYQNISRRLRVPAPKFYEMVKEHLTMRMIDDMLCMGSPERTWHMRSGFGDLLGSLGVSETQLPPSWTVAIRAPAHEIQPEPTWVTQAQVVYQVLSAIEACLLAATEEHAIEESFLAANANEEHAIQACLLAATEAHAGEADPTDDEDIEDRDAVMLGEESDVAADESDSEDDEVVVEDDDEERTLENNDGQSFPEPSPVFKAPPLIFQGIDFNTAPNTSPDFRASSSKSNPFLSEALIPKSLSTAQKEWLLETEWAQRAFLASYTLAVMDNVTTFRNVHTFTVTKLSSRYLPPLQRTDFWVALPNLDTVTMIVSPDWRDVIKEHAGYVADSMIAPSEATGALYRLVEECIAPLENIKTLTLGFIGGGERATGIFARNKHVLPAPIMENPKDQLELALLMKTLHLPYVEHLTFTNCWFAPHALRTFVTEMRQASLHTLRLESVSLTAMPSIAGQNLANALVHAAAAPIQLHAAAAPIQLPAALLPPIPPALPALPIPPPPSAPATTPPPPTTWLTTDPRPGSWPDIIDKLTPGRPRAALRTASARSPRLRLCGWRRAGRR